MSKPSKNVSKYANQYTTTWTNAMSITGLNPSSYNYTTTQPLTTWGSQTGTITTTPYISTGGAVTVPYNPNQYGGFNTYTVPAQYGNWSIVGPVLTEVLKELLATYGIKIATARGTDMDWSELIEQMAEEVQGYYYFRKLMLNKAKDGGETPDYMYLNITTPTGLNETDTILLECMVADVMMKGLKGNKTRIRALKSQHSTEEALYLLLRHMSKVIRKVEADQTAKYEIVDYYKLLVPFVIKPLSVIYSGI